MSITTTVGTLSKMLFAMQQNWYDPVKSGVIAGKDMSRISCWSAFLGFLKDYIRQTLADQGLIGCNAASYSSTYLDMCISSMPRFIKSKGVFPNRTLDWSAFSGAANALNACLPPTGSLRDPSRLRLVPSLL